MGSITVTIADATITITVINFTVTDITVASPPSSPSCKRKPTSI